MTHELLIFLRLILGHFYQILTLLTTFRAITGVEVDFSDKMGPF
jgi:hypothetical protein